MTSKELWHWVHSSYGHELGLTGSDDDYMSQSGIDDSQEKGHHRSHSHRSPRPVSDRTEGGAAANGNIDHTLTRDNVFASELQHLHNIRGSAAGLDVSVSPGIIDSRRDDAESSGADSTGEVVCADHDHLDSVYLNEAFSLPVDKVFEFLFSDSKFFRDFCMSRKTLNLSLPDWQPEPNAEGNREREIRYTLTLDASIGPKYSPSYENQVCNAECQPGFIYVIDAHCFNGGIPYADAFYVTNRYCLTRVTRDSCRLRVTSELRYTKSIWSLVKKMIEKNARRGLTAYFQQLESHLRREATKYEQISPSRQGQKKHRRQRRKAAERSSAESEGNPAEPAVTRGTKGEGAFGISAESLVRLLCFILVLLFVFNAVLFYKLFYLEGLTNTLYYPDIKEKMEHLQKSPHSSEEWLTLLQRQQRLHRLEVDKWQDILTGAVSVLDQMKETLSGLREMLKHRQAMESSIFSSKQSLNVDT